VLSRPALAGDVESRPGRASIGLGDLAWAGSAIVAMCAYRALLDRFHGSFIPQGTGMSSMLAEEVAQLTLFVVFGLAAGRYSNSNRPRRIVPVDGDKARTNAEALCFGDSSTSEGVGADSRNEFGVESEPRRVGSQIKCRAT